MHLSRFQPDFHSFFFRKKQSSFWLLHRICSTWVWAHSGLKSPPNVSFFNVGFWRENCNDFFAWLVMLSKWDFFEWFCPTVKCQWRLVFLWIEIEAWSFYVLMKRSCVGGSGLQEMSCISRRVTNVAERNANCCSRQQCSANAHPPPGFLSCFEGAKKLKASICSIIGNFFFADFLSIWIHS